MVKRIIWTRRPQYVELTEAKEMTAEEVDKQFRERVPDLPAGPPKEGWRRNVAWGVEISLEKFTGSLPAWIWEE